MKREWLAPVRGVHRRAKPTALPRVRQTHRGAVGFARSVGLDEQLRRALIGPWVAVVLVLIAAAPAPTTSPATGPTAVDDLRKTVAFLASDDLGGRLIGTPGLDRAGDYLAGRFAQVGLRPPPGYGDDFQRFDQWRTTELAAGSALVIDGRPRALGVDFSPHVVTASGPFAGPVVFAGYGVVHSVDGRVDYDDYAGVDVRGKVVLLLDDEPVDGQGRARFAKAGQRLSGVGYPEPKLAAAAAHGATAVLLARPRSDGGPDWGAGFPLLYDGPPGPIPFVAVTRTVADEMLARGGRPDLATVERRITATAAPRSAVLPGVTVAGRVAPTVRRVDVGRNVVAVLPGTGPTVDEWVVVGAHYDHLGRGQSGIGFGPSGRLYPGADDNASGVAAVLAAAARLSAGPPPRRSVLFALFAGEEEGHRGSAFLVAHSPVPLGKVAVMVNLDMVGRLATHRGQLLVSGEGTAAALAGVVDRAAAEAGVDARPFDPSGRGPSDQASFAAAGVPVLFLFTGVHRDWHTPADTPDKVDYAGLDRVATLTARLVTELSAMPRQAYDASHDAESRRHWSAEIARRRPVLGVTLDGEQLLTATTAPTTAPAARVAAVDPGSPAAAAGLRPGDRVVAVDGHPIATADAVRHWLAYAYPGLAVDVSVVRDGRPLTVRVTLGGPG